MNSEENKVTKGIYMDITEMFTKGMKERLNKENIPLIKEEKSGLKEKYKERFPSQDDKVNSKKKKIKSPTIIRNIDNNNKDRPLPKNNKDVIKIEVKENLNNEKIIKNKNEIITLKEVPESLKVLKGLTFVLSGLFSSIGKQELKDLLCCYGARVTGSVSSKTNFLVIGYILEDKREPKEGKKYKDAINRKKIIMNEIELTRFLKDKLKLDSFDLKMAYDNLNMVKDVVKDKDTYEFENENNNKFVVDQFEFNLDEFAVNQNDIIQEFKEKEYSHINSNEITTKNDDAHLIQNNKIKETFSENNIKNLNVVKNDGENKENVLKSSGTTVKANVSFKRLNIK